MAENSSHITDWIETYLANGLDPRQRAEFQSHLSGCPECGKALEEAVAFNASMQSIFGHSQPAVDFEDRLLGSWRSSIRPPLVHPMVRRAAIGIAATLLLGGFGYVASTALEEGRLPMFALGSSARAPMAPPTLKLAEDESTRSKTDRSAIATPEELSRGIRDRILSEGNGREKDAPQQARAQALSAAPATRPVPNWAVTATPPAVEKPMDRTLGDSISGPEELGKKLPSRLGLGALAGEGRGEKDGKSSNALYFRLDELRRVAEDAGGRAKKTADPLISTLAASTPQEEVESKKYVNGTFRPPGAEATPALAQESHFQKAQQSKEAPVNTPANAADEGQDQPRHGPATDEHQSNPAAGRKIIRSGELSFEVDSFDSSIATITRIVDEEGGFVSTTDSDKLANGKVKGTIVLRVPPEHLDTLVLKLRGIGDLKSQKINAQDITKQYTDLESELRAAQAMENRLLDIIKNGKGEVKDLLEAEKQLGVWREKIEQVTGEIRYYNNLVSLSTLSITLMEKDIRSAAYASESEQVTMSLETTNVESVYDKARQAIESSKGRIIQSDLQQHEAGQYSGTIVAALPPDAADAVIARLRQLDGRVAAFQRQRAQKNQGGSALPLDPSKLKREDVTLSLTLYNLANVAPRRTVSLLLAAPTVEETYVKALEAISSAGGRIVSSSINRGKPEQATASISFQVASEKADVVLAALRASGEVVHTETADNPDTQNATEAKRGFVVTVESLAAAAARQTQQLSLAAISVPDAFNDLMSTVLAANGRIIASQLNQEDRGNVSATLEFEISRTAATAFESTLKKAGQVVTDLLSRSADTENSVDSKIHFSMSIVDARTLAPRQKTTMAVEVDDVAKATRDLLASVSAAGGRPAGSVQTSQDRDGHAVARVLVDVPLDKAGALVEQIAGYGTLRVNETSTDEHAPEGRLAHAQIEVTLGNSSSTVGGQDTAWDAVRHGLSVSGAGLRWSLTMIVIGFCFVAPWVLVAWGLWRVLGHRRRMTISTAGSSQPAT